MKYITVKLTEDQIRALVSLSQEYMHNLGDYEPKTEGGRTTINNEMAFFRRLCAALGAKHKS